ARVGLFDKPDDLLGAESALLHVRPLGFTDFIASAGTAQWGQVRRNMPNFVKRCCHIEPSAHSLQTSQFGFGQAWHFKRTAIK
ncbi:hypothetical protein, partial [Xanthomonas campestris]|uniref:hypothetical protein n=1 Tax=Xanthomonas campestris TaxID=339 RepID=UPI0039C419B7